MQSLLPLTTRIAVLLKERKETIAVAESSAGGLISASLLAVPGASVYFLGGAVIYTRFARRALLGIDNDTMRTIRPASEPYAALLARTVREKHGATWGLAETGATGPSGNPYGDAAGHACLAVDGPAVKAITLETASPDREANMRRFAETVLTLLLEQLEPKSD